MLKKILAILAFLLYASASFAAVDVNKASAAELDGVKGIGPGTSKMILDERKKGEFKDWADLIARVKGIGDARAAKLSAEGLTVGGAKYKKAAAKKEDKTDARDEKKDDKKEAKAAAKDEKKDDKAAAAKPAASAAKPAASAKK